MQLSLSIGLHQRQEQRTKLQQEQIAGHIHTLRVELIQVVHDERYRPEATCPKCHIELATKDILTGFNRDPDDFTTCCPRCSFRFRPRLVCIGNNGSIEMPFYCDIQTLSLLKGKDTLTLEQLKREHSEIYRSAIYHYGSIRNAFHEMGIQYELTNWGDKIRPFLGRLPDTMISKHIGQPVSVVRKLRKDHGIPRYTKQVSYDEIEETA